MLWDTFWGPHSNKLREACELATEELRSSGHERISEFPSGSTTKGVSVSFPVEPLPVEPSYETIVLTNTLIVAL